jgi:hypothetical protein
MTTGVRLLWRLGAAAAALALVWWAMPRAGLVFVGGWSMAPALCPGDLVVYRRGGGAQEGDIALAAPSGAPAYLHRVVAVQLDGALRTKGDANEEADAEPTPVSEVAGVAVGSIPSGRVFHALVTGLRWCYNHVPIANTRR